MIRKKILQAGLGAALATAGLLASGGVASGAGVDMYDGQWRYSLTPYAWFPNISQTLQFNTPLGGGKTVEVEVKPDSYLSDLDFALMGDLRGAQGRLGVGDGPDLQRFQRPGREDQDRAGAGGQPVAADRRESERRYPGADLDGDRQLHRGAETPPGRWTCSAACAIWVWKPRRI